MNRKLIFDKLLKSGLDSKRIIVITGASLVVQNIIETTSDIDITCDKEYYDSLDWPTKIGAFGVEIKYKDVFEISNNLYYPKSKVLINGFQFLSVEKCLEIKEKLHREKDKEVIKKIRIELDKENV